MPQLHKRQQTFGCGPLGTRSLQLFPRQASFNEEVFGYQSGYFLGAEAEKSHNLLINISIYGLNGGERGIRTLDRGLTYTPLAGERLQPLGHLSVPRIVTRTYGCLSMR